MLDVNRLYPQYAVSKDRRKENVSVPFERRSGIERRSNDRVVLDTNLTRDIFEVRNKVTKFQNSLGVERVSFSKNVSNAAVNNIRKDEFVKSAKETQNHEYTNTAKAPSATALMGGILAVALTGVAACTLLGTAGAVVAACFGAYIGGKLLKQVVVSHMVDKNKKN